MISVSEAIDIILGQVEPPAAEKVPLSSAGGRMIAADVHSDIDMPPFNKSFVDGFAVRAEETAGAPVELRVVGRVPAGLIPGFHVGPGEAAKVMTGAPIPEGATAVQMVEETVELTDRATVRVLQPIATGKNIAPRAADVRAGDVVVKAGSLATPAVCAVLASVGCVEVPVFSSPRCSVLTTGNELVEAGDQPGPGQIRNSNSPMLMAQVRETGCDVVDLGTARDDSDELESRIARGLEYDLLLVTGGVSMGELDLVEDVFSRLGVQTFFDKVAIKPGKPTVFGRRGETLVFGLPGNPVSALTVFEILVRPALRKRMGFHALHLPRISARLAEAFRHRGNREDYHPSRTRLVEDGGFQVEALPTHGSADLVAFSASNSFLVVPREARELPVDSDVHVVLRNEFWVFQDSR